MSARLNIAARNVEQAGDKLYKLGTKAREAGEALMPMSAAVSAAAGVSVKFAADFESAMTKVVTIAGESDTEINKLKQGILDLAPTVGIGPKPLADALLVVESTGLRGQKAMDVLTMSARSSALGLGETKDIARALTAAINAYGSENLSASKASDVLFQAVKAGGAEASEFAGTLGRVVGIAAEMGVSFEEVTGFIATFTRLGVNSEEAVTALRATLTNFLNPAKQTRDIMNEMGESAESIRIAIKEKGLAATLSDLTERLKGNEDALGDLIPNTRALAGVLGTAGSQGEQFRDIMNQLAVAIGEQDKAFRIMADTGAHKWNVFTAELQKTAIAFGQQLAPYAMDALNALKPLLAVLTTLTEGFAAMPGPVKTAIMAIGGFAALAGPALYAFGSAARAGGLALDAVSLALKGLAAANGFKITTDGLTGIADAAKALAGTKLGAQLTALIPLIGRVAVVAAPLALVYTIWSRSSEHAAEEQKKLEDAVKAANEEMRRTEAAHMTGAIASQTSALRDNLSVRDSLLKKPLDQLFGGGGGKAVSPMSSRDGSGAPAPDAIPKTNALTDAVEALRKRLADTKIQAQAFAVVYGDGMNKTKAVQQEYLAVLQDVVDQYGSLKAASLGSLELQYQALDALVGKGPELREELAKLTESFRGLIPSSLNPRDLTFSFVEAIKGMSKDALPHLKSLNGFINKSLLPGKNVSLGEAPSFFGDLFKSIASPEMAQKVGASIMSAIQGGGNVAEAAAGTVGLSLGTSLSKKLGKMLEGVGGFTGAIGGAFAAALPGIGAMIGPVVGAIVGHFTKGQKANDLRDKIKEQFGDAAGAGMQAYVDKFSNSQAVRQAYQKFMTAGTEEAVAKAAKELEAAVGKIEGAMGRFGLSLNDVGSASDKFRRNAQQMVDDFRLLGEQGFTVETMVQASRKQLEALVEAAKATGQEIPPALWPLMKELERLQEADKAVAEAEKAKQEAMEAAAKEAERVEALMSKYGVTVDDLKTKQQRFAEASAQMVADLAELSGKGFGIEDLARGGSQGLQDLLAVALETGEKLPASLQPYIEELIRTGQISDELKEKMLGVADPVPWQEMEKAAEKYGISVEALGKQFEQAKLTDGADELLQTWDMLVKNGADVNGVMEGMKDEVSGMVEKALKLGLALPEAMKPLVTKMADAGKLVDENGDKLEDIGKLEWAKTPVSETDRLIAKLDELVDKLTGPHGLTETFASLKFEPVITPVIKWPDMTPPNVDIPYMPPVGGEIPGYTGPITLEPAHTGAYITASGVDRMAFDEVPALLQAGEVVLSKSQVAELGRAQLGGRGSAGARGGPSNAEVVRELQELRRDLRTSVPTLVSIAARDAALLARR